MAICKRCRTIYIAAIEAKRCSCVEFNVIDQYGDSYKIHAKSEHGAAMSYAKRINQEHDYYLVDSEPQPIVINGNEYRIGATVNYSAELQGDNE